MKLKLFFLFIVWTSFYSVVICSPELQQKLNLDGNLTGSEIKPADDKEQEQKLVEEEQVQKLAYHGDVGIQPIDDFCKLPVEPENGQIIASEGSEGLLQLTYLCNKGFILVGHSTRLCEADGWSGNAPTCKAAGSPVLSCSLGELKNAREDTEDAEQLIFMPGHSIDIKCLPGYHYHRNTNFHLVCMNDGNWDIPIPECEAVECEEPEEIANGHVTVDRKKLPDSVFTFGDQISYSCDMDYSLEGPEFRWCESGGWSGSKPKCQAIVCKDFPDVTNGKYSPEKEVYLPGEEIQVQCHMGYKPVRSSRAFLVCNERGGWSFTNSNCTAVTCDPPETFLNGLFKLVESSGNLNKDVYEFLDKLSFTCDPGFVLTGKKVITCRQEGWADPIPTCQEIVCGKPSEPANGWIKGNSKQEVYQYQDKVVFECENLYRLIGSRERTCTERGWTGSPAYCDLRGCPPPEKPSLGGVVYQWGRKVISALGDITYFPFKEKLGIICPPGFKKSQSTDAVCQLNGKWSKLPNCIAIECPRPYNVDNGHIEGLHELKSGEKYPFQHKIFYSCNSGYRFTGSKIRTCEENGWTPRPKPSCEVIQCNKPDWIGNGGIENIFRSTYLKYNLGHQISYYCHQGFRLKGEVIGKCTENGWLPQRPPTCEVMACQQPYTITAGYINGLINRRNWSYEYPLGHELSYHCNPGYRLVGPETKTCETDGWSHSLDPICEVIACSSPHIPNGQFYPLTQRSFEAQYPGGMIRIACVEGYRLIGNQVVECTGDGTWNETLNKCQEMRRNCDHPGFIAMGSFQVFGQNPYNSYSVGSRIIYQCRPGYQLTGVQSRDCTEDGWSGDPPTCLKVCVAPSEIDHGMLIKQNKYFLESEAEYKCFFGFELQPLGGVMRCTESGWVGPQQWCKRTECLAPDRVNRSEFIASRNSHIADDHTIRYVQGTTLTYRCLEQYRLNGEPQIHCLPNGQWSPEPPECEDAYCTKPVVKHLVPVSSHFRYNSGDQYQIECLPGFKTIYSGNLTCITNGTWSPSEVTCEEIICTPPALVISGEFTPLKPYYSFGESVSYRCPGANLQLEGIRKRTCTEDGWDGESPKCVARKAVNCLCPIHLNIGHKIILDRSQGSIYQAGQNVSVVCSQGYKPVGNPEDIKITCTPDGNWSTEYVRCNKVNQESCPEPPQIKNGYLLGKKENYVIGDSLTIVCKAGHRPATGTEVLLCRPGSKWDEQFSDCEAVTCDPPKIPANGNLEDSDYGPRARWPYYSEASFKCLPGFQLIGHHWIKCLQEGWSSRPPICKEITCTDPGTPEAGWKNGDSFAVGARVQFSCFDGYKLYGPKERICLKNGQWSDEQPYCHSGKTDCSGLATPSSGFKSRTHYSENDVVTFTCHSEYMLIGSQTRKCIDGSWTGTNTQCVGRNQFDRKEEVSQKIQLSLQHLWEDQTDVISKKSQKSLLHKSDKLIEKPVSEPLLSQRLVVYLLLDSSSSIGQRNFQRMKDFSKALIQKLQVSKNGTRVGLITFSSRATVEFFPSDFTSESNVLEALYRTPYREGSTSLQAALEILGDMMKETEETMEGVVAKHHVFLFTDGKVNSGLNPVGAAKKMKERFGATFTCIGLTGQWRKQILYLVATDSNHVFYLDSFSVLDWLTEEVKKGTVDYSKCGRGLDKFQETEDLEHKEWPWTIYLSLRRKQYCRGSIINSRWILTSAWCLSTANGTFKEKEISLKIGLTGESIDIHRFYIHPKYDRSSSLFNAGLIKLNKPIVFSQTVRPVCLPSSLKFSETRNSLYEDGEYGYATSRSEGIDHIRHAPFFLQKPDICSEALNASVHSAICAGDGKEYLDCLKGDCGGPLIQYQMDADGYPAWIQIAIATMATQYSNQYYNYFTDVSKVTDWIETILTI